MGRPANPPPLPAPEGPSLLNQGIPPAEIERLLGIIREQLALARHPRGFLLKVAVGLRHGREFGKTLIIYIDGGAGEDAEAEVFEKGHRQMKWRGFR